MTSLLHEIRFGLRLIRRNPTASLVVILTLALGIAANAGMFAGYAAWVLRPLDFTQPERLVALQESQPRLSSHHDVSAATLRDWRESQTSFEDLAAFRRGVFNLEDEQAPERVHGAMITANLFPLLGVEPAQGRNFVPGEDDPAGPLDTALISHDLWLRKYGGDPAVLGRPVRLDGRDYRVVGVMKPGFAFPEWADAWVPLAPRPDVESRDQRRLDVVGRLKPGVALEAASAEMAAIGDRIATLHPETNAGWSARVTTLRESFVPPVIEVALTSSLGAALFVLLIICANVTNLFLARATTRRGELAVRKALGASRLRLLRQTLVETTILALAGGVLGVFWAIESIDWMKSWVPVDVPYLFAFRFDATVVAYTLAVSMLAGLACGLAPALRSQSVAVVENLKGSGGRAGLSHGESSLRNLLVVAEFALSMILLVGALLMVKSFLNQREIDPGFQTERLHTLRFALTDDRYAESAAQVAFLDRVLAGLKTSPSIDAVGAASSLPTGDQGFKTVRLQAEGRPVERGEEPRATFYSVTSDYLGVLAPPLLEGRLFTEAETRQGGDVAIVSRGLGQSLWGEADPLGKRLAVASGTEEAPRWLTVVGVVGDVRIGHDMVSNRGTPEVQIYAPWAGNPSRAVSLLVQSRLSAAALAPILRERLRQAEPRLPVSEILTMDQAIDRVRWTLRYFTQVFALYAALAVAIAALGAYGVTAESVSRRMRDMAIRLALGAPRASVRRQVVARAVGLAFLGVLAGGAVAFALTRFGSAMLYDVSPHDPRVFGGVALLMLTTALLAAALPARKAARVDLVKTLRSD